MMDLLNAKTIKTTHGLELYLDLVETIKIKELHIPTISNPYYEVKFEIDYFLLEEHKYYDLQQNYFSIVMSENFSSIMLKESEMQSLFGVKNEKERKATKQLLSEWLIKTSAYKEAIIQFLNEHEEHNTKVEENQYTKKLTTFLKKLLELKTMDIEQALIQRPVYS
ncbi:hypothetical protein ACQKGA_27525 [Priestia megaterium]|uniref:hypothetical protein n=1 Tax=Priestia megaterium TaxID=1404 RepID=UPI003D003720